MITIKQWDISRALAIASLFHFFHSVGKFCVMPFLTIFFRQLGLSAPYVGIIMGVKHTVYVFWAPLCSFLAKSNSKRRIVIMSSLFFSAGTGVLFAFLPPLDKNIVFMYCNASLPWRNRLTTPVDVVLSGHEDSTGFVTLKDLKTTTMFPLTTSKSMNDNPVVETTVRALESPPATNFTVHFSNPSPSTLLEILSSPPITPLIQTTQSLEDRMLEVSSTVASSKVSTPIGTDNTEDVTLSDEGTDFLQVDNHTSSASLYVDDNTFAHKRKHRDVALDNTERDFFLDDEHKIFLIVLGAVIVWEIFSAPLEWTTDDSLHEYLDCVDATERHGKLWIWTYLGAILGSSFIAFLVDNLNCFVTVNIPRVSFHFYCYAGFMIAALVLGFLYPIQVSLKKEHTNKTMKALHLIGTDGRIILLTATVFLTGAIGSTAHNFLFWKMQDVGSSELYMGLSVAVAFLSEIILYLFKAKLLKALTFRWAVAIGLSCMAIQFLLYSFLWTSWAVLPVQLLSAFSNGALWWAVNSQADDVATPGTERSMQLVLQCLSYSCGAGLGSFASGFIIRYFNLAVLYQACSITLILWTVMFLVVQPKLPHLKKINYSRLLAADNSDMSDSEEEQERDWLVKAMKDENYNRKWST